jgi:hypothetical protein
MSAYTLRYGYGFREIVLSAAYIRIHCETQGVGKSDEKGWNVQIMPEKVVFRGSDNLHHFDSESNSTY